MLAPTDQSKNQHKAHYKPKEAHSIVIIAYYEPLQAQKGSKGT